MKNNPTNPILKKINESGIPEKLKENKKTVIIGSVIFIIIIAIAIYYGSKNSSNNKTGQEQPVLSPASQLKQKFLSDLPELQKRVEENPNDSSAQQQLGVAKYATGDIEGAKQAYEKTLSLDNENAVAHNNLGNVYRDMGDYGKAEQEYKKAMELNPQLTTPYLNLGSIYQHILSKPDEAIEIYEKGISANPDYVDLYNLIAAIYEEQGDKEAAIKYYQQSLDLKPDNPAAVNGLERLK